MRSLVVTKFAPWPRNGGDKCRSLGIARSLQTLGPVTIVSFAGADDDPAALAAMGFDVATVPLRRTAASLAGGLRRGRSLTAARFWDRRLCDLVADASTRADLAVVGHVQFLPYLERLAPRCLTVLDMHNVESLLTRRYSAAHGGLRGAALTLEARALRGLERRAARADVVSVVSEADRRALAGHTDLGEVVVVPNAWDDVDPLPASSEPVVSFVATFSWAPNVDAATWFVRSVWPLVRASCPAARLELVGRNPAAAVLALASDSVVVTGTVADLDPYYARCRVAVAPLRAGGGSRLKILEALGRGRPVVATTVGAEGLEDLVGRGVDVADDARDLAARVAALLGDPDAAARQGALGAQAVAADHSWVAATAPLLALARPLASAGAS